MTLLSAFLESLLNFLFNKLKKYMKSFTTNIIAITFKNGRLYTKNRRTVEKLQNR